MYNIKSVSLKEHTYYDSQFVYTFEVGDGYTKGYVVSIELNSYNNLTDFAVKFSNNTQIIIPYHNVTGYEVGEK